MQYVQLHMQRAGYLEVECAALSCCYHPAAGALSTTLIRSTTVGVPGLALSNVCRGGSGGGGGEEYSPGA